MTVLSSDVRALGVRAQALLKIQDNHVQTCAARSVQVASGEMPQQFVGCNIQRAVTSVATGDCFQDQIETDQISCNSRTASAPAAFRASVHVISKYSPAELVEVLKAIIFRANQPLIKSVLERKLQSSQLFDINA